MDMVQPDLTTPQAQSLISSLNYDGNASSNIHHGQHTSQTTQCDVSSVSGSHQMLSFSWG
uniref:Uncharacterized protein n=1 Tax=Rhizophora mucronata TaxID=61149 RepID=A0A2P2NFJ9_RHIMU